MLRTAGAGDIGSNAGEDLPKLIYEIGFSYSYSGIPKKSLIWPERR